MTKGYVEKKYNTERDELIRDIEQQIADLTKFTEYLKMGNSLDESMVSGVLGTVAMRRYVKFKAQEEVLKWYDEIRGNEAVKIND